MPEKPIPIGNRTKREIAKPALRLSSYQIFACAVLLCGAIVSAACAEALKSSATRRPLAVIVLKPGSHPMEQEAADDLRWAVREATGVTLDVVPEALGCWRTDTDQHRIHKRAFHRTRRMTAAR